MQIEWVHHSCVTSDGMDRMGDMDHLHKLFAASEREEYWLHSNHHFCIKDRYHHEQHIIGLSETIRYWKRSEEPYVCCSPEMLR